MAAQPAGRTRDELDETFEILDRDGAVVVFGGDLTLEQKSVFCCIVARDPMSVAIECPARDIAAAEAGLPRRDYDEALAALERGGYIVDIVTPYGEDRDGELCMVPIPAEVVREGVQCRE